MNSKQLSILNAMVNLGLIEVDWQEGTTPPTDLINIINLVNDLFTTNDLEHIKQFMIYLLYELGDNNENRI